MTLSGVLTTDAINGSAINAGNFFLLVLLLLCLRLCLVVAVVVVVQQPGSLLRPPPPSWLHARATALFAAMSGQLLATVAIALRLVLSASCLILYLAVWTVALVGTITIHL